MTHRSALTRPPELILSVAAGEGEAKYLPRAQHKKMCADDEGAHDEGADVFTPPIF